MYACVQLFLFNCIQNRLYDSPLYAFLMEFSFCCMLGFRCLSLEDFVRLIVSGACRGDAYVKFPGWYDIFFLYRVFAPDVLNWTLHLIFSTLSSMKKSLLGMGRPPLESTSPRKLLPGPLALSPLTPQQQQKLE